MGAGIGVLRVFVGLAALLELYGEGATVVVVDHRAGLVVARNPMIIMCKEGSEVLDELRTARGKELTAVDELGIPNGDHGVVPHAVVPHLLQQTVALFESFGVAQQMLEVLVVGLRDDAVHELAAEVAATGDELLVVGRHHDEGNPADVLGEGLAGFLIPFQLFTLPSAKR